MDVEFDTRALAKLCNTEREVVREFGQPAAGNLMRRLGELAAAKNLAEIQKMPQAGLHPLKGKRRGQWSIVIHRGRRLVFEPLPEPVPTQADGGVDLVRVTGARVVFIGDYHD